jgi:hypothetical protein
LRVASAIPIELSVKGRPLDPSCCYRTGRNCRCCRYGSRKHLVPVVTNLREFVQMPPPFTPM